MNVHQLAQELEELGIYSTLMASGTRRGVKVGSAGGAPILVADELGNIDVPDWLAERMDRYAGRIPPSVDNGNV